MFRNILLFGAGKSASHFIKFFLTHASRLNLQLTIVDLNAHANLAQYQNHPNLVLNEVSFENKEACLNLIKLADVVVSLLPAMFHINIARYCLEAKKNLLTASYISPEMKQLHQQAIDAGLTFVNEIGLDPGIDHLSAMKILDGIRNQGGTITHFESYAGGLIAPESDHNPWHYKFTWNPQNVVLAGSGGLAKYRWHNEDKLIAYPQLFSNSQSCTIKGLGSFETYPNRDSLVYAEAYGLQKCATLIRGTLRIAPFCSSWHILVQLGLTENNTTIAFPAGATSKDFFYRFLPIKQNQNCIPFLTAKGLNLSPDIYDCLNYLGFFDDSSPLPLLIGTPAQILQALLETKWKLDYQDLDMIVMLHQIGFTIDGKHQQLQSTLVVKGENQQYTAMSKTVGLPLAFATLLVLNQKVTEKGVIIPLSPEWYNPILASLETEGIVFTEHKN